MSDDYIGLQIGDYIILDELATGPYCTVYRGARVDRPECLVVVKVLEAVAAHSEQGRKYFLQEAGFLDMLRHPHIIQLLAVGEHGDLPYIVTEYALHGSLQERLEYLSPELLFLDEVLAILSQIGQALSYAHQKDIVHGDLKPGNILFNASGEAVLVDFGLARQLDGEETISAGMSGSIPYLAPERFNKMLSKASDQYALGCIAYELVTGRIPFVGINLAEMRCQHMYEEPVAPTSLNPSLPLHVEQAILKAMAKEPTERHADMDAFIAALSPASVKQERFGNAWQKTAEQWIQIGQTDHICNRYEQALLAYDAAMQLDKEEAYIYENKAVALYALTRYREALENIERALELGSKDPDVYAFQEMILQALNGSLKH